MAEIRAAERRRRSPFCDATIAEGAKSLVTCNRMPIPRGDGDREAEYRRPINGVSTWDVAGQRQIPDRDAARVTVPSAAACRRA